MPVKHKYGINIGNGTVDAISSETKDVISFEPVIAPKTNKRGIGKDDDKPTYSLRVDNEVLVFGAEDVYQHGQRENIRRLNSSERYTHPDYFNMYKVAMLRLFAAYRGMPEKIIPTGAVSIPIRQYNNKDIEEEILSSIEGEHHLLDYMNCELHLDIRRERTQILPECYGSFMHNIYDPKTLKKRPGAETGGITIVVDVGYETVNLGVFEGLKYQRAISDTIPRAGMGIIAREIVAALASNKITVDVNRVDRGMKALAGLPMGAKKDLEIAPGFSVDVTQIYDDALSRRAAHIAQEVSTRVENVSFNRVRVVGGGAYHLRQPIADQWSIEIPEAIDPQSGEAQGIYTMLSMLANK